MAEKVDRTHIRNPFDVDAEYDWKNGEVALTFTSMSPDYKYKEVVVHMKTWLMSSVVYSLKDAYKEIKKEGLNFEQGVESGVQ